jgi:hypothetical protein
MSSERLRRGAALLGGIAIAGGILSACSSTTTNLEKAPTKSNVAPSSRSAPAPTEKNIAPITPGQGPNTFAPGGSPHPAPAVAPGDASGG